MADKPKFGGGAACPRCTKPVYFTEQVAGPGGLWHKACLTCKTCNKSLTSTNIADRDKARYGYGGGAGVLSTETKINVLAPVTKPSAPEMQSDDQPVDVKSTITSISATQAAASSSTTPKPASAAPSSRPSSAAPGKYGGADPCGKCAKAVYFAEQIMGPGNIKYHKMCFKCSTCNKLLDSSSAANKDTTLYCRPCHARQFGPKGFGIGGIHVHTQ
eukprot:jgi/Hompol1/919/HPOL_001053-RA